MRDKRFIVINIASPSIAYSVIDGRAISFYDNNGKVIRSIDLTMMLDEVIDIPLYFKMLFEKGMDVLGCLAETEDFDLNDYYGDSPYGPLPPGITRVQGPEVIKTFDLDDRGMVLTIQMLPQINTIYYDFNISTYRRLIMDLILDPINMLYVDSANGYVHTMEHGHDIRPFNPMEILSFLHPEIEIMDGNASPKHVMYI